MVCNIHDAAWLSPKQEIGPYHQRKKKFLEDKPCGQDFILSYTDRIGALNPICTNPISTAECMHDFSSWNRIKNKLRNHVNASPRELKRFRRIHFKYLKI